MSDKSYYFNEFSKDDVLYSLAQKAKDTLQNKDNVLKIYRNYEPKFYGLPVKNYLKLISLNNVSVVSSSQQSFPNSPKDCRVSISPETTNQVLSTPAKRNQNISTSQRKHLLFDNVGNEVSQSVTESPEEQSTPVKIFRSATEPESSPQQYTSLISVDKGVAQTALKIRKKQSTPVKVNENITELENFSSAFFPLDHKETNKAELVILESHTPVRRQTVIVSPQKIDREIFNSTTKVGTGCINPTPQDHGTVGSSETYTRQTEKFDEPLKMPSIFTSKVKEPLSSSKDIGVDCVRTTDGGKNTRPMKKATTSANPKSFSPTGETAEIIQTSKGKKKDFSPVKKVELSISPMSQKSVCSDSKYNMLVHSYQDIKKNVTPNEGNYFLKNCERKRNSLVPGQTQYNAA